MPKTSFDYLWELLAPVGEFVYRDRACRRLWDTFNLDKQHEIYRRIRDKKQRAEFVNPNPYYAIVNNVDGGEPTIMPPTDYNHSGDFDRMVATGTLVTAEYQGQVGIYTEADATKHHMTIIKHLHP